MTDRVPETRDSGFEFWKCHGKMGFRKVEEGLSSFFAEFLLYLMIFQSGAYQRHCINHQIEQDFDKK